MELEGLVVMGMELLLLHPREFNLEQLPQHRTRRVRKVSHLALE